MIKSPINAAILVYDMCNTEGKAPADMERKWTSIKNKNLKREKSFPQYLYTRKYFTYRRRRDEGDI